jgi:hypothetical protein
MGIKNHLGKYVAYVTGTDKTQDLQVIGQIKSGDELYTLNQIIKAERNTQMLSVETVHVQINYMQHEILTVVEAVFAEKEQRDAVKNLIKASFNKRHAWLDEIVYGTRGVDSSQAYDADPRSIINAEKNDTVTE